MNISTHTDHHLAHAGAFSSLRGPRHSGLAPLPGDSDLELAPSFVVTNVKESLEKILAALLLSEETKLSIREQMPTVVISNGDTSYFQPSRNIIAIRPDDYLSPTTSLEEAGHYVREYLMPLDQDLNSNVDYVAARDEAFATRSRWWKTTFLKVRKAETEESKALAVIGQVHEFFGSLMVGLQDQVEYESRDKNARTPDAILQFAKWKMARGKLEVHTNQIYKNEAKILELNGLLQDIRHREGKLPKTSLTYLLRCAREIESHLEHLENTGDDGPLNKSIQRQWRKLDGLPHFEWGEEYVRYLELGGQCLKFSSSASGARPIFGDMIMGLREHKKAREIKELKIAALRKSTQEHKTGYAATKFQGRDLLRKESQARLTALFQMPSLEVFKEVVNLNTIVEDAFYTWIAEETGKMQLAWQRWC
jgi:hypothetical protein